eukprot:scaffold96292_cov23-Tisochrysis_lutea.AAC.1
MGQGSQEAEEVRGWVTKENHMRSCIKEGERAMEVHAHHGQARPCIPGKVGSRGHCAVSALAHSLDCALNISVVPIRPRERLAAEAIEQRVHSRICLSVLRTWHSRGYANQHQMACMDKAVRYWLNSTGAGRMNTSAQGAGCDVHRVLFAQGARCDVH